MDKRVILDLHGNLSQQGFHVSLEIYEQGNQGILCGRQGNLPASAQLASDCNLHWQIYRSLATSYRIKNKQIITQSYLQSSLEKCQQSSLDLKQQFNQWLKSEEFSEINDCIREQLNPAEQIRFLIRSHDQELQKLPWHEWDIFRIYTNGEIGFTNGNYQVPKWINSQTGKVKVLVILGNSQGINIEYDQWVLNNLPDVDLHFLDQPQRREINNQLWDENWDIIFFAGHSQTESRVGLIDINPEDSITIEELCNGLRKAIDRGLKLAIFNSCDGLGLGESLYQLNIHQVIVMREVIPDRVAHQFAKDFLQNFSGGKSLYISLREAREKLQGLEDEFPCATWLPIIFQNPGITPPTWEDIKGKEPEKRGFKKIVFVNLLLASFVGTALVMGVRTLGFLQSWELQTYDQLLRMRPEEKPDPRLVVVAVTDQDMQEYPGLFNDTKITDQLLLDVIKKINKYQPKTIGLDILRDISTYSSNQQNLYPQLTNYLQNNSHIFPICKVGKKEIKNNDDYGFRPPHNSIPNNISFNDIILDDDKILRRHLIYMTPPHPSVCKAGHALSSQLARDFLKKLQGIKPQVIETVSGKVLKLGQVTLTPLENQIGFYQNIDDSGYQILLNYRHTDKIATEISLQKILDPNFRGDVLKNKIVLIGYTSKAKGNDFFFTAYTNQEIPGVKIHAQMTSHLISMALGEKKLLGFLPWKGDGIGIFLIAFIGGIPIFYCQKTIYANIITAIEIICVFGIYFYFYITGPLIPAIMGLIFMKIYADYLPNITTLKTQLQVILRNVNDELNQTE